MKLYYSGTSPYVRKVIACAIVRGLDGRIEKHGSNPHASPADLLADNPLSRVPALVTDDGMSLYDSPVICEYLDSIGDAPKLFPASGPSRWRAPTFTALGVCILDVCVACRGATATPQEAAPRRPPHSPRGRAASMPSRLVAPDASHARVSSSTETSVLRRSNSPIRRCRSSVFMLI